VCVWSGPGWRAWGGADCCASAFLSYIVGIPRLYTSVPRSLGLGLACVHGEVLSERIPELCSRDTPPVYKGIPGVWSGPGWRAWGGADLPLQDIVSRLVVCALVNRC